MNLSTEQEQIVCDYYKDNAKKLRRIIDGELLRFGGIYDKDKEDFYSLGNEVFLSAVKSYKSGGASFRTFLTNCISNKVKSEMTRRNAMKRSADLTSIDDESFLEIGGDTDVEADVLGSALADQYMKSMSRTGKKIIAMRLQNKTDAQIEKELNISHRRLDDEIKKAKKVIAFVNGKNDGGRKMFEIPVKEKENKPMSISISPDYRDDYLSVDLIREQIEAGELLINHPNQRNDWMWSNEDISTLIATNLHGFRINPIIVCEEKREDGTILNWIVDGKQRVTSMIHFAYPADDEKPFRVSKKTEYSEIPYQTQVKDENGNVVRDEYGRPVMETRTFDIRGKRFCDFPVELQRKFKSYVFSVTRYVNCDSDMISYHIRRYNKGKAMNAVQKANTYLSDDNAARCKKVSQNVFFENLPDFTEKKMNAGASERVVMDAIMAMNYRDDWSKKQIDMYSFYNENGEPSDFDLLDEYLTRLNAVLDEDTEKLFTTKDAYLFIALFHHFAELGLPDGEFNDFLRDFIEAFHEEKVGEYSFDDRIGALSTRDRGWMKAKMEILETLLDKYF